MADDDLTTESTVYATYIRTTPERAWEALTSAAFTSRYFFGRSVESDWRAGSPWLLRKPDGEVDVWGVVREAEPLRRLVVTWNVPAPPGVSYPECVVSYEIEPLGPALVRLVMTEAHPTPIPARLLEGGRRGWPMILSGLKSLLETGEALEFPAP